MPYHIDDEGDLQRMPGTHRCTSHTPVRQDTIVHTPDNPFCYDPLCSCHRNQKARERVQQWVQEGLLTENEAIAYLAGRIL